MLWIKTLHIVFMVTWFAGLFYLPRLFVYHAMSKDKISHERFIIMERKLFFGIMTPGAFLTIFFGGWLWNLYGITERWLEFKVGLVILLLIYHYLCFKHLTDFKNRFECWGVHVNIFNITMSITCSRIANNVITHRVIEL